MTGFYLLDHPPASPQFRTPRREPISGVVVVHTTESVMDNVGPDTGAENVAGFISRRSDPGSYHELVDADSVVPLVPDGYESFQVAVDGHNRHAWGISFACRSSDLNPDNEWTRRVIAIAGVRIREFWLRTGHDPHLCARWITRDDAINRTAGLVTHGAVQPADRSDAWTNHPRRADLERMLVAAITDQEPDDMTPAQEAKLDALLAATSSIQTGVMDPVYGLRTMVAAGFAGIETVRADGTVNVDALVAAIKALPAQTADEITRRLAS